MADTKVVDLAALSVFKTLQDLANAAIFICKDGDKVLSSNDFTDTEKAHLAELTVNLSGYQVATDEQVDSMLVNVFGESSANFGDYQVATDEQVDSMLVDVFGE